MSVGYGGNVPAGVGTTNTLPYWIAPTLLGAGPAYNASTNAILQNSPFINVMAAPYNATGNGSTDDTAAIQAAINAAPGSGATIYFPPGTYNVSVPITISSYSTLLGAGMFSSTIVPTSSGNDVFDCNQWQISFQNLGIVGPRTTVTSAGATLSGAPQTLSVGSTTNFPAAGQVQIALTSGLWTTMAYTSKTQTSFVGCTGAGVFATSTPVYLRGAGFAVNGNYGAFGISNTIDINSLFIQNMYNGIQYAGTECNVFGSYILNSVNNGIVLNGNNVNSYISEVTMNNEVNAFANISVQNCGSLLIDSCDLIHGGNSTGGGALHFIPNAGGVFGVYAANTYFDSSYVGVNFAGGTNNIQRIKFNQCWMSGATSAGVVLNNSALTGLDFVACDFYNQPLGISALAAAEWSVANSRFAANSTAGIQTTAAAGMSFGIYDNVIGPTSGYGANGIGINIQAGTYAAYQILGNRQLDGNTTAISDLGTVTGFKQKQVADNIGLTQRGKLASITAATAGINSTETILTGGLNNLPIPANSLQPGDTFQIILEGTVTSSAANVSTFAVRLGTAGTTADALILTGATAAAATTGTNIPFDAKIIFTVRTIGASATLVGNLVLTNQGITGISTAAQPQVIVMTPSTFNSTVNNYLEVTYKAAAATTTATFSVASIIKF